MALWLQDSIAVRAVRIASVIALYWLVSIPMVFLNKYIFSSDDVKLNAPFFITWYQCLVSTALSWICLVAANRFAPHADIKWLGISPEVDPNVSPQLIMKILPLSVCFVAMVGFNNLCIKYVAVSFYMVVRSLATFFNVVFMFLLLNRTTSYRAMTCCLFIIIGFLLGVDQEDRGGTLSWLGVFFGIASSLFAALNGVFTTRVLPSVNNSPMKLALCNNLNACLLFLPFILLFGEYREILVFPRLNDLNFWFFMTISGILGWSVSLVTSLQILVTSPLTHNISGTSKSCVQTLIAVIWYDEFKTVLWWLSNMLVLLGSASYTFVRHMEMELKQIIPQKPVVNVQPRNNPVEGSTINLRLSQDKVDMSADTAGAQWRRLAGTFQDHPADSPTSKMDCTRFISKASYATAPADSAPGEKSSVAAPPPLSRAAPIPRYRSRHATIWSKSLKKCE